MKNKACIQRTLVASLAAAFLVITLMPSAFANYGWKKGHDGGLEGKFRMKVHFIESNQDELKLTEEQMTSIDTIETNVEKSLIQLQARVDLAGVDLKGMLHERKIDVEAVNRLLDEKYGAKEAIAKALVQGLADVKNVLTDEQYAAMKELWKSMKK